MRSRSPLQSFRWRLFLGGLVVSAAMAAHCGNESVDKYEKKYRPVAPVVQAGKIHYAEGLSEAQKQKDTQAMVAILSELVRMVDTQDLRGLPALVSQKQGLWVDVKAHRSYADLLREVNRRDGYLQKFLLDSEQLRRLTQDERSISIRDVLRYTDIVRADFYMLSDGSCEVELFLEQYPPYKHHLNQPAFIKEGDQWKLLRLF